MESSGNFCSWHGSAPVYLSSYFTRVADVPSQMRHRSSTLDQPRYCQEAGLSSLHHQSLEQSPCTAPSLTVFRHHLETFLFRRSYHDLIIWQSRFTFCCGPRSIFVIQAMVKMSWWWWFTYCSLSGSTRCRRRCSGVARSWKTLFVGISLTSTPTASSSGSRNIGRPPRRRITARTWTMPRTFTLNKRSVVMCCCWRWFARNRKAVETSNFV